MLPQCWNMRVGHRVCCDADDVDLAAAQRILQEEPEIEFDAAHLMAIRDPSVRAVAVYCWGAGWGCWDRGFMGLWWWVGRGKGLLRSGVGRRRVFGKELGGWVHVFSKLTGLNHASEVTTPPPFACVHLPALVHTPSGPCQRGRCPGRPHACCSHPSCGLCRRGCTRGSGRHAGRVHAPAAGPVPATAAAAVPAAPPASDGAAAAAAHAAAVSDARVPLRAGTGAGRGWCPTQALCPYARPIDRSPKPFAELCGDGHAYVLDCGVLYPCPDTSLTKGCPVSMQP
jgi:hypothetical protein